MQFTDLIIIGGGEAGCQLANNCNERGLAVSVIALNPPSALPAEVKIIRGRGVLSHSGFVSVLNPDTGDEIQILEANALALATGRPQADHKSKMQGVSKYGIQVDSDGLFLCDATGMTGAPGIFAYGPCASVSSPHIYDSVAAHCAAKKANEQV